MADKVLVTRIGQKNAKPVKMDARLARTLVAQGRLQYVTNVPLAQDRVAATRRQAREVAAAVEMAAATANDPVEAATQVEGSDEAPAPKKAAARKGAMTTRDMKTEETADGPTPRTYKRRDERAEE